MSILRNTFLIVLILLTLTGGACWFYADRILDDLLRPHIEQLTAKSLDAEVEIESLRWTAEGLDVIGWNIHQSDLHLTLPKLEIQFTLGGLWQRRLDAVRLITPHFEAVSSSKESPARKQSSLFPDQLPLTIDRLTVVNGDLLLTTEKRSVHLQNIDFSGAFKDDFPFKLDAFIGPDKSHPLLIDGKIVLSELATLTLNNVVIQERSLLSNPFSLLFANNGLEQGGGNLRVAYFNDEQLRGILAAFDEDYPLADNVHFELTDSQIAFSLDGAAVKLNLVVTKGQVSRKKMIIPFAIKSLQLTGEDETWLAQGDLAGAAGSTINLSARYAHKQLAGRAEIFVPRPDELKTELLGGTPIGLAGKVQLDVEYSISDENLSVSSSFKGQPAKLTPDYRINIGHISGSLDLHRAAGQETFSFSLQHTKRPLLKGTGNKKSLKFTLELVSLTQLETLLNPALLPQKLEFFDNLSVSGHLPDYNNLRLESFELAAKKAGFAGLSLQDIGAQGQLHVVTNKLIAKDLIFKARVSNTEELTAQLAGEVSGSISAEQLSANLKKINLVQIDYMSADGQSGLGNGHIEVQGSIKGSFDQGPLLFDLSGTTAMNEILIGEFYADLSALEGHFKLSGDYSSAGRTLTARSLQVNIPALGSVQGSGRFNPEDVVFQATVDVAQLAEAYGQHIGLLLSEHFPETEDLSLEGLLSLDADLHWTPNGWRSSGELRPQGLNASWRFHKLELVDGTGKIPFAVSLGQPPAESEPLGELPGDLSFDSLSVGLASVRGGNLQFAAAQNHFAIRSPLLLQLAKGQVAIEDLSMGWGEKGPSGSVRISINDVDLEVLTGQLELPLMKGTFTGDLGLINYTDHQLSTAGTIKINVFGGRILIQNMRYQNPFSRSPVFQSDIDFSGIKLKKATRTFEFGEMNGVIDGQIHGLRLFGTTPSAFTARLESRTSGKRNISVKALNNLSILSQGGISAALSRGLYQFIDFYRYRKIGFACSLENDTFTLIGTALRDSTKYLVAGALLPPRIDITTTTPTISFKEMVNRLSRIDRAGD